MAEFWQTQVKRNPADQLQTPNDVYSLPVEEETNEIYACLTGCHYNHIEEANINVYDEGFKDIVNKNKRVVTKIHMHFDRDCRRYWRLASVWYRDKDGEEAPFMVIRNAGREGDDFADRIITDTRLFLEAIRYLVFLKEYHDVEIADIYDGDIEIFYEKCERNYKDDTYVCAPDEKFDIGMYMSHYFQEEDYSIGRFYGQEYFESVKMKEDGVNPYWI